MNIRWWWCALAAAALAAAARGEGRGEERGEGEGDAPSALDGADADDDLPLRTEESRNVHPRAYQPGAYNALPSGFRPAAGGGGGGASLAELAGYARPQQQQQRPRGPARPPAGEEAEAEAEEEEEREEPDRLAQLLQQSRFDCGGKQTGYYADADLQCEVFHYCQDNVKHSWICPEGFSFHQVHLICMPPTQENICQQSAKYHFVNEYLYRPVNEDEVQRKPSTALRYSDRYYPAEVYHDDRADRDDDDDEEPEERPRPAPRPAPAAPPRPAPAAGAQVFRSAEEVNIPLLQRRPQRPYDFRF